MPRCAFLVEGLLWLGGVVLYERATRSRKRAGSWAMYFGVLLLTRLWILSLNGAAPQVSMVQMAIIDLIFLAIVVSWAYLVDKLRVATGQSSANAARQPSASGGLMPGPES